ACQLRKAAYCCPCQCWLPSMCLPSWNFTGGAFAVFGCFGRSKCCGLTGLPAVAALPAPAALPTSVGLPISVGFAVVFILPGPFALPTSAGLPVAFAFPLPAPVGLPVAVGLPTAFPCCCETCPAGAPFFLACPFFPGGDCAPAIHESARLQIKVTNILIRLSFG